ncbi:MAG: hypothetical protein GY881_07980 [Gammaproteobacteria bacterium]|uniref:hypothetical protein n=1 Tax=Oceanicoccus sp. TaxID=2691044 RepID=UPI00262C5948|nr:hypothetical protein [Oceanicoccus sp.]MCP3906469.1 hypothetical protein [Oceanicoccus sp.]MCP4790156.1 hypothetical protein [Gammaproteobacteria bacterium]MCP4928703.1 hypothetical protein [Gammaproteobacteria bacterium]
MLRIFAVTILALLAPTAFCQDKWSLETSWENDWGHTGPGIYADSTGKLRLHKKADLKSSYFCEDLTLSAQEFIDLEKIIKNIPEEIPYFSSLAIGDTCSDEAEISLIVDIDGKWRHIKYTQPESCRWDKATPAWLTQLDSLLQVLYSRVKNCA